MLRVLSVCILCLFLGVSCSAKKSIVPSVPDSTGVPEITFVDQTINLGDVQEGQEYTMIYEFKNTGTAPLVIDLVTACKCTSIDWPPEPIPIGEVGKIKVVFDSSGFQNEVKKTIDIIANTDPIVAEAFFVANVLTK